MSINLDKYALVDFDFIKNHLEIIKFHSKEIVCLNEDNICLSLPNHKLDILFDKNYVNSDLFSKFYITKSSKEILDLILEAKDNKNYKEIKNINQFLKIYKDCLPDSEITKRFEYDILEIILRESPKARAISLENHLDILNQYYDKHLYNEAIDYILDIMTELAFIERINLIHLVNAAKDRINQIYFDNVEYYDTQHISNNIILSVTKLIDKIYPNIDLFYKFDTFTCRNVIGHGNRVFIMFIEFFLYYNEQVKSQFALKTIANFNKKFKKYYKKIFKHYKINKKTITFESIFKNGLKKISLPNIAIFAAGAFWHDVVKIKQLDYLNINKSKEYNKKSTSHAIKGYQFLKLFRNYNDDISLIVGMHHEYYGHGYSVLRAFMHKQIKENKEINPIWLISSNSEDIERLESLAFLPAKILEIVDLYDTIVLPQKNYDRSGLEAKEAVKLIYKNYIKDDTQIDPILFDLFINFLKDVKKEDVVNPFDEQ
ncbi:phosphohydrolase [uncultured Brachyspira sp.]|uniref:phosphohydrolase n=1 Tax=uncultured Brachyspira sp. TaxID=221953 RepID=UPI0026097634|nr:phosphohydrolase [uncultured Brachyspira sp.]